MVLKYGYVMRNLAKGVIIIKDYKINGFVIVYTYFLLAIGLGGIVYFFYGYLANNPNWYALLFGALAFIGGLQVSTAYPKKIIIKEDSIIMVRNLGSDVSVPKESLKIETLGRNYILHVLVANHKVRNFYAHKETVPHELSKLFKDNKLT